MDKRFGSGPGSVGSVVIARSLPRTLRLTNSSTAKSSMRVPTHKHSHKHWSNALALQALGLVMVKGGKS
jgi:hypothetical protein